jgi:hypothetical protein
MNSVDPNSEQAARLRVLEAENARLALEMAQQAMRSARLESEVAELTSRASPSSGRPQLS